jgi:DNA (cytosine-5)-methyltransferase 1
MSLGMEESCRALEIQCDIIFAAELDPVKAAVYRANFPVADVRSGPVEAIVDGEWGAAPSASERALMSSLGKIDVLLGGPPCQGHSDLNNHTRRDDARNGLVMRMARFAELFRPGFIVIENVEGVRHDKHRMVSKTASCLRSLGYTIQELLVPCLRLGVPQSRRRYMLVAVMNEHDSDLSDFTNREVTPRTVEWAIGDLVACTSDSVFDTPAKHSTENARRIRYLFDQDIYDLPNAERPACHRLKVHSYNSVYGRMRWNEPAPTITTGFGSTGQGRFVHPLLPRTLTPHEAARLQTYPDFFNFGNPGRTQLQKMIGNSVPPLAMLTLGLTMLR